jgi:hypothetical protein
MFIDHKKKFAAASASFCVRSVVAFTLILGSLGAGVVHAEGPDGGGPQRRDPPPQQQQGNASRSSASDQRSSDARSLERYEARTEEQRRQMQDATHNAEINRRMNRMTPDERRDLRRQINEVGQDLYALPPRR